MNKLMKIFFTYFLSIAFLFGIIGCSASQTGKSIPGWVLIYPNLQIDDIQFQNKDMVYTILGHSQDDIDKVLSFYKTSLEEQDWKELDLNDKLKSELLSDSDFDSPKILYFSKIGALNPYRVIYIILEQAKDLTKVKIIAATP